MVEVVGGVAKCQICRKVASPVILSVYLIDFVIVFFLLSYRFCNCFCRKVVVRGIYCTCDPMIGWHKHCMAKQVKANVETVCKKCKTTVHLDQGRVGTQQINRKRKGVNEDEEMEVGTQEVDKEAGRGGDEEEEREPTTEGDEDEEMGKGSSKEKEKSKRRGRRRINVASDSD